MDVQIKNMRVSKYQKDKIFELQEKAFQLYREGTLTTRQVGPMIGRSYAWVSKAVKTVEERRKLPTIKEVDKAKQKIDNK